jgi:hypothetical protein
MKKFILLTKSESGDNYHYFVESPESPTKKQIKDFLWDNGNDKGYEFVTDCIEIDETLFKKINP